MKRVLAIDPTTRGFGYAVLEGPDFLVDWGLKGTSRQPASPNPWCLKEATRPIREYLPEVVALEDASDSRFRRSRRVEKLLRDIAEARLRQDAKVRHISKARIGRALGGTASTKYKMALELVRRFPELAWRLPPVRKPWMSEDARMAIFGAVALGLASYGRSEKLSAAASTGSSEGRIVSALNGEETTPSTSSRK